MTPTFVSVQYFEYLILTFLHCIYSVFVMNEGNIAAEAGVEDGVSYVEKNNLGTVTAKQFIALKDMKPFQATEKSINFVFIFCTLRIFYLSLCNS